jgi:NitT/TauT family transport system ATP-binding protein
VGRGHLLTSVALTDKLTDTLRIEGLSYSYRGLEVFKDFSLHSKTKITVLRGASGCGKTTLLKLLSGNLQPDRATTMPETKGSCLVLQEDSLFPWLTGIENISKLTKIDEVTFRQHPMYALIAKFVDRKACRMSYGQRRMVELFRAIVFRPRFLYLDEPFNFLDEDNMGLVVPFLQDDWMKDTTLVLSNHHKDDVGILQAADVFKFDGKFPISSLNCINKQR